MYLEQLELTDFRNYPHAAVSLRPGVSVLVGDNAQGKTNLLEALHYLAIGGSHRVTSDAPLVRVGAEAAVIRAAARTYGGGAGGPGRGLRVELELRPAGRNRARVNGQPRARVRDAIGLIRSVLFAPEDLHLVRGDPGERRRFLDQLLGQRRASYLAARQDYERILRQRNALLRAARHASRAPDATLEAWNEAFVARGAALLAARVAVVHALAEPVERAYRQLVEDGPWALGGARAVSLEYRLSTGRSVAGAGGTGMPEPAELAEELRAGLAATAAGEGDRGLTLVGPHRDDLLLGVGDLPAKGYASHGETWSLALALRLGAREVLQEVGDEPIVLLDDVFAELDEQRRRRLAEWCGSFGQVLVTTAVDQDVPLDGARFAVSAGAVARALPRAQGLT